MLRTFRREFRDWNLKRYWVEYSPRALVIFKMNLEAPSRLRSIQIMLVNYAW